MWEKITGNWWTELIFGILLAAYVSYKVYTGVDIETAINSALGVIAYIVTTWGIPGTKAQGMFSRKELSDTLQAKR